MLEYLLQALAMVGGISALTLGYIFRRQIWAAYLDAARLHHTYDDWRDMH